jgi:hypothetical protein
VGQAASSPAKGGGRSVNMPRIRVGVIWVSEGGAVAMTRWDCVDAAGAWAAGGQWVG